MLKPIINGIEKLPCLTPSQIVMSHKEHLVYLYMASRPIEGRRSFLMKRHSNSVLRSGVRSQEAVMRANYLFLDCLYVKRFRVLRSNHHISTIPSNEENCLSQSTENRSNGENIRNIFTQLPPNHLLSNLNLLVRLPVVDGKAQAHEVG